MDASTMDPSVSIRVPPPAASKLDAKKLSAPRVTTRTLPRRKRDEALMPNDIDAGSDDLPNDSDRDAIAIQLSGTGHQGNAQTNGMPGGVGVGPNGAATTTYLNHWEAQHLTQAYDQGLYQDAPHQPDFPNASCGDPRLEQNRYYDEALPFHGQSAPGTPSNQEQPAQAESSVTGSPEREGEKPKKKSHARKQPRGHIPRPRNAFILFRKHITDNNLIPTTVEVKHQNVSVIASKMWAEAPPEVKTEFVEAAPKEKEDHARKYPHYRYQPAYRRTDIIRRRVRKDPNEEEKCDAVASLLMEGKVGKKLETEIVKAIATKTGAEPAAPAPLAARRGRRRKDTPGELSKGAMRAARAQARAQALRETWIESTVLAANQHQQAMKNEQDRMQFMQHQQMQHDMERYHYQNGLIYSGGNAFGPHRPYDGEEPYHPGYGLPDIGRDGQPMAPYPREYGMVYEQELPPMASQQQEYGGIVRSPLDQVMFNPALEGARGPPQQSRAPEPLSFELDPRIRQVEMYPYGPPVLQEMRWDGQPHSLPLHAGRFAAQRQDRLFSPHDGQPHLPHPQQDDAVSHSHQAPGHNFPEGYAPVTRPSDIIVSNWKGEDLAGPPMPFLDAIRVAEPANIPTADLLPFLEAEEAGPSHEIDFGDKGELFGGLLGSKQPGEVGQGTEGMEDYQQALRQQEEMEFGLQRF